MALAMAATMSAIPVFAGTVAGSAVDGATPNPSGSSTTSKSENQSWNTDGNISNSSTKVTWEVVRGTEYLVATVPVELPIVVNTLGDVTVPTDAKIINNCDKEIAVTKIEATQAKEYGPNGEAWVFCKAIVGSDGKTYNSGTGTSKDNHVGLTLRGDTFKSIYNFNSDTKSYFNLLSSNWTIPSKSELPLNMGAAFGKTMIEDLHSSEELCSLQFTIGFTGN